MFNINNLKTNDIYNLLINKQLEKKVKHKISFHLCK